MGGTIYQQPDGTEELRYRLEQKGISLDALMREGVDLNILSSLDDEQLNRLAQLQEPEPVATYQFNEHERQLLLEELMSKNPNLSLLEA